MYNQEKHKGNEISNHGIIFAISTVTFQGHQQEINKFLELFGVFKKPEISASDINQVYYWTIPVLYYAKFVHSHLLK